MQFTVREGVVFSPGRGSGGFECLSVAADYAPALDLKLLKAYFGSGLGGAAFSRDGGKPREDVLDPIGVEVTAVE